MQSFEEFAPDCAAFAEKVAAFRQDHLADLLLGDAETSVHAVLINRVAALIPALHLAVLARGHEVAPPPPSDPMAPGEPA